MLLSDVSVGDWIRTPDDEVTQVLELDEIHGTQNKLSNGHICFNGFLKACELWQPKEDEWCWFWNNNEGHTDLGPRLAKFMFKIDELQSPMDFPAFHITKYKPKNYGYTYDFCQPFIGELPTYLKGL